MIALAIAAMATTTPARADGNPTAHEIAQRFAADAAPRATRSAQAGDVDRRAWETDMLERARAEAAARRREADRLRDAESTARQRAEAAERAARKIVSGRESYPVIDDDSILPERRSAPHSLGGDRSPYPIDEDETSMDPKMPSPTPPRSTFAPPRAFQAGRYAILVRMEPGHRGIRKHNRTADPVICVDDSCYVSNGPEAAAAPMPPRRALGFLRTWSGARAGACNHSLGCVFRDVELGPQSSWIQPVDMRLVRHDRREAQRVEGPSDCSWTRGRLACTRAIRSHDYVIWIVPESLAQIAGPDSLMRALEEGLVEQETARYR